MEKRGKRIRKARITTAAATTMTLKLVVIITNRSLKSCFDFASHGLSIKLQRYCLTRSLGKEQRKEKQSQAAFDTPLKTVPQIELIFVSFLN